MRTILPYLPLFLCAGTMVVCVRMMSGKHDAASPESTTTTSSEVEPDPSARADR
jgi:hypothetical protein